MGISIHLQTEKGNVIESIYDERNLLHRILPAADDARFHSISRIDWYGDTTFNRMQMKDVIRELGLLVTRPLSEEEREVIAEIISLAKRGIEKPHFYLKFCGD